MKYVVDTCIINKLVDGVLDADQLPSDGEVVASHIQVDELNKTPDEERRARLFLKFSETVKEVVPTESTIIGVSRIGHSKISDGDIYTTVKSQLDARNGAKSNNVHDALIAEVAIKNGYMLLTADWDLNEVTKAHGGKVRYWKP